MIRVSHRISMGAGFFAAREGKEEGNLITFERNSLNPPRFGWVPKKTINKSVITWAK